MKSQKELKMNKIDKTKKPGQRTGRSSGGNKPKPKPKQK